MTILREEVPRIAMHIANAYDRANSKATKRYDDLEPEIRELFDMTVNHALDNPELDAGDHHEG